MANTLQKQAKRISLVLTLAAVLFTAVDNYLYLCHGIDIAPVTTSAIIVLAVSIVLCGVLQRYFYRLLTKYATAPSTNWLEPEGSEAEYTRAAPRSLHEEIQPVAGGTEAAAGLTPRQTHGCHP